MTDNLKLSRYGLMRSTALLMVTLAGLSACAFPSSGPSTGRIVRAAQATDPAIARIRVIELTDAAVQRAQSVHRRGNLLDQLGDTATNGAIVGRGDTLEVTIWEAPPAVLYGATTGSGSGVGGGSGLAARSSGIPEQVVDPSGQISVPFVGNVSAAGRLPSQIAAEIQARLIGKAHLPQVIVRRIANSTANVTVVGDVNNSRRMELTPKGERLLDALASAGGTKEPVGKVLVQITRGSQVASAPLEAVIRDPRQNIRLAPDDVVTLLYQPYSFTALGAVAKAAEVPFEGTGLTLAQALGRIGGLQEQRSDPKGVFIFRMEYAEAADNTGSSLIPTDQAAPIMVPVVYQVNMGEPTALFLAQRFEIRNRDVLYVSNSPITDLQTFLGLVSQAAFSLTGVGTGVN